MVMSYDKIAKIYLFDLDQDKQEGFKSCKTSKFIYGYMKKLFKIMKPTNEGWTNLLFKKPRNVDGFGGFRIFSLNNAHLEMANMQDLGRFLKDVNGIGYTGSKKTKQIGQKRYVFLQYRKDNGEYHWLYRDSGKT